MATTTDYDLNKVLPGVLSAWRDAAGCRWCYRDTQDSVAGHDGYCPVPAVFKLSAEVKRLGANIKLIESCAVRESKSLHAEIEACHNIMARVREESVSALKRAELRTGMTIDAVRALVNEVERLRAAAGERDALRLCSSLLVEWRRTPFFETRDEWEKWVSDFGVRVDAALHALLDADVIHLRAAVARRAVDAEGGR